MRRGRVCVTQALLCGRGSASSWGVWEVVAEGDSRDASLWARLSKGLWTVGRWWLKGKAKNAASIFHEPWGTWVWLGALDGEWWALGKVAEALAGGYLFVGHAGIVNGAGFDAAGD